jgi:hypothetical protein
VGWLEVYRIMVSVNVGFLWMEIFMFDGFLWIVMSRKLIALFCSGSQVKCRLWCRELKSYSIDWRSVCWES